MLKMSRKLALRERGLIALSAYHINKNQIYDLPVLIEFQF